MTPAAGTSFPGLTARDGRRWATAWPKFFARCAAPVVTATKEDAARWSAATFTENRRAIANVERISALVLDADAGVTFEVLADAVEGRYALVHSTWSHTLAHPRWRVVLPFSRFVSAEEYARIWRAAAIRIEAVGVVPDHGARDAAHIWAVPAVRPGAEAEYVCRILAGGPFDVDGALATVPPEAPMVIEAPAGARATDLETQIVRARAYVAKMDPAIQGANGSAAFFRVAVALSRGFALPREIAFDELMAWNAAHAAPPFTATEALHKLKTAEKAARMPLGFLVAKEAA